VRCCHARRERLDPCEAWAQEEEGERGGVERIAAAAQLKRHDRRHLPPGHAAPQRTASERSEEELQEGVGAATTPGAKRPAGTPRQHRGHADVQAPRWVRACRCRGVGRRRLLAGVPVEGGAAVRGFLPSPGMK